MDAAVAPGILLAMLYAILCYDHQETIGAWTKEEDDAAMVRLGAVQEKLAADGRLGPVVRLQPTATAKTVRKTRDLAVMDGPFAETKEHLLGFFVVDCADMEQAVETARQLARANYQATGSYEIRPIGIFHPGVAVGSAGSTPR
jgi:hypothetical protein